MQKQAFQLIVFFLIIGVIFINLASRPDKEKIAGDEGFVVMELFTSQGCNSCPPADALLGKWAQANNPNIIVLAYHVDYWNKLGWTDPFSSPAFSARQREYAMALDDIKVYTPQLILNGEKELNGRDEAAIKTSVEVLLEKEGDMKLSIERLTIQDNKIEVAYKLKDTRPNLKLHAALVQAKAVTQVLQGENRGRKLINYNLVRGFKTVVPGSKEGKLALTVPAGVDAREFFVALFVQEDASARILAATKKAVKD